MEGCLEFIAERSPLLMLGTNDDEIITDRKELVTAY
jgi:hypothetical protein